MLDMSVEEVSSYEYSLSNLAMLKIFHDAGVDVSGFCGFMTDINYNDSAGLEIFMDGCHQLFSDIEVYSPYIDETHEKIINKYSKIGHLTYTPEQMIVIKDVKFRQLFKEPWMNLWFHHFLKKQQTNALISSPYFEGDLFISPDGFVIALYYEGHFHEIAKTATILYKEMNRVYELVIVRGEKFEISH